MLRLFTNSCRFKNVLYNKHSRLISHSRRSYQRINVCIIGSGPAGFYTAQQALKNPNVYVDIYEKLPVPFGLVRYGVAPDHPEVKNVINSFTSLASDPRLNYFGNVTLGKDVSFAELQKAYNCTVMAYGADQDSPLAIPGEDLKNVLSARKFVGWYNGLPCDSGLNINLDIETAVIIGQGNVALDVARILLTPIDKLKITDITENALEALSKSKVKKVILVGRRGPLQVAFTIKELRELVKLEGCQAITNLDDFAGLEQLIASLPRPRKRLTELILQAMKKSECNVANKKWELKFLRSPIAISSNNGNEVSAIKLAINKLQGKDDNIKAVQTDDFEVIESQLVLRSIGYKSISLEESIPFDHKKGILPNEGGRVLDSKGLYCSGWVKTGPVGVIVSTMNNSFETGQTILKDIENKSVNLMATEGNRAVLQILKERGVKVVDFASWLKIDAHEQKLGEKKGKPREKIISVDEMLNIASK